MAGVEKLDVLVRLTERVALERVPGRAGAGWADRCGSTVVCGTAVRGAEIMGVRESA